MRIRVLLGDMDTPCFFMADVGKPEPDGSTLKELAEKLSEFSSAGFYSDTPEYCRKRGYEVPDTRTCVISYENNTYLVGELSEAQLAEFGHHHHKYMHASNRLGQGLTLGYSRLK